MYINNKILIGKCEDEEIYLLPNMANRHGIISGASGSGKTISLKVLAESFSEAGVPVFLVDVKGDLAGMGIKGEKSDSINKRIEKLKLNNFEMKNFPVDFWDVYGSNGHPIRTTVSKIGPKLLSKMLGLSNTGEDVLTIIFKIANDENLELIDLNDLRSVLNYVGEKRKEYTLNYGNITLQSIGTIQRSILSLQSEGGDYFFGKPDFNIKNLIHYDSSNGYGLINILDATKLFLKPDLYATFLIWILNEMYQNLPEVGDIDKPKIVMFFDEAHLIFSRMSDHLIQQIIGIVKLIRSKGVGLYFITQTPSDIPDEILSQLGNRIQHVLRSYTKSDEKSVKAAADSFRINPSFNITEAIKSLGIGEALVSVQDESGCPTITKKVTIVPPQSKIGPITFEKRNNFIQKSDFYMKYEKAIDIQSATEKINAIKIAEAEKQKENLKISKKENKTRKSSTEKIADQAMNTLGRKIGNSIFKGLFK